MITDIFIILIVFISDGFCYECYVCPTPQDLQNYIAMDQQMKEKGLTSWSTDLLIEEERRTLRHLKDAFINCRSLLKYDSCNTDYGCFMLDADSPNERLGVDKFVAMGCVNPHSGGTELMRDQKCDGKSLNYANEVVFCHRCTFSYCNYDHSLKSGLMVESKSAFEPVGRSGPDQLRPLKQWERDQFSKEAIRRAPRFEGFEAVPSSDQAKAIALRSGSHLPTGSLGNFYKQANTGGSQNIQKFTLFLIVFPLYLVINFL